MIDSVMNALRPAASLSVRLSLPRRWLIAVCLCVGTLAVLAGPSPARAQEEEVKMDARLEGYPSGPSVSVSNQSTALMWLLFVFLGVLALAGLFKDAKRSHLD